MYKMLQVICEINGYEVHVDQLAYGGYSLQHYVEEEESYPEFRKKMQSRSWDYVFLQDQSRKTLDDIEEMRQSVKQLVDIIQKQSGEAILYSTWSYREHSNKLKDTKLSYDEFSKVIKNGYKSLGQECGIEVVYVGDVFSLLHRTLNLLVEDDFHPNILGSYIVANMFYHAIFGKNNFSYKPDEINKNEYQIIIDTLKRYLSSSLV